MIIPVRCFQCGRVLGDQWKAFQEKIQEKRIEEPTVPFSQMKDVTETLDKGQKTPEGAALDELGITRYCCRTVMLGNVDLTKMI